MLILASFLSRIQSTMYVFIKTPLYKNSKYLPHLVEHCILTNNQQYSEYISTMYDNRWVTFCGYTKFYIPSQSKDTILQKLQNPITRETIEQERKIIKDELSYTSNTYDIFEKIGKKLYGKTFKNNDVSKVTYTEIKTYHKKWYTSENIIICDDNYNIISSPTKLAKQSTKNLIQSFTIKQDTTKYQVFSTKFLSFKDFYTFKFLEILVNSKLNYHFSQKDPKSSFEVELFDILEEYLVLAIPQTINISITDKELITFKKYFFQNLDKEDYKLWIILSNLLLGQKIKKSDIKKHINSITMKEISSFL